ncbi:Rmf/CrpP fold protein [Streptomyces sioyaensis]|uniref:Rmf/CrpP fold protein n=1 Tax=Streptomyces sioyaensis TaxID=67364 RepID=UPI00379B1161
MASRGDRVRAINAGAEAGHNGNPVTSFPFPAGDLRRETWVRGYRKTHPLGRRACAYP